MIFNAGQSIIMHATMKIEEVGMGLLTTHHMEPNQHPIGTQQPHNKYLVDIQLDIWIYMSL